MCKKHLLTAFLFFLMFSAFAQTYHPGAHVVVNDAVAATGPVPLDARTMFYDSVNFLYRAYNGPAEVLTYLNTNNFRTGNFILVVDSGGALQSNGTYIGGYNTFYMFKDSTTAGGLVKMNLFGMGAGVCTGCLQAASNLSDLASLSQALINLGLNNVNNTSDATKNAATVTLTNHTISGAANTLTNIANSSLSNSTIGLTLNSTGTTPQVTSTPASLGGSLVVTVPWANGTDSGFLRGTDWNFFNGKLDSVRISNDSVFNCVNGTCTLQSVISGTGGVNSVNGTNSSLLFSPSTGNVLGQVNPAFSFNWGGQHTFVSFPPIFSTLTTAGGLFYGDGSGHVLQTGAGTSAQILESQGGSSPIFFTPSPSTVTGWLGYTPLSASLPSTQIYVGNAMNTAAAVNMSGDVAINNVGATTIQAHSVTLGKMATNTANTLLGYDGSGNPSDVTVSTGLSLSGGVLTAAGGALSAIFGIGQVGVKGTDSVYKTDSGWFRGPAYNAGIVISATLQNLAEPSPAYDTAQIISTVLPVVRLWYTDDTLGVPQVNYAESITGAPGTWVQYGPVITGHYRGSVVKNGGYYYYFGVNQAETQVDEYVSPHGAPGSWTLLNAAVITASSLGTTNIYNNSVYINQATGTWYMLLDVNLLEYGYCDYGLTSTNSGATWTAVAGNPVLPKLAAPWLTFYAGKFYCWGLSSGTNAFLPSDVFEYSSTNFTGPWTMVQTGSVLHRLTNAEGVNGSQGQIADPALVSLRDSSTLIFVTIDPSGNQSAGDVIAAYRSPQTITQLITTSSQQNAPFTPEWDQLNGGQMVFNNGNVGIGTWAPAFPLYIGESPGSRLQGYPGASVAFAQNFISSTPFGHSVSGYNLYNATYGGWQLADSTENGYAWDATSSSGLTAYYAVGGAGHSLSQPIPLGSWFDASSHSVLSVGTIGALARIMINSTIDDGTGNTLQMNGYGATMGNIFGGKQFNGWYVGTNASTSAGSANISFFPSLNFAAGLTGTHNIFIDAGNTVLSGSSSNNIAIGTSNSTLLNGGSNNIDIGPSAFNSNVSGSFNTGMGQANLQSATGSHNSGFGDGSGRSITSGSYDLALGSETFYTDGIITSCATCVGSTAIGDSTQVLNSNTIAIGGEGSNQKFVGIDNPAPTAFFEVPAGTGVAGQSGFKFFAPSITTTAASGTGTAVTLTFATQPFIPFHVGQIIVVSGMVPSGYNGTYAVTICTLTTVTFLGSTTGSQTGAGTIVVTGKPASTETWALGPSGDTLWWIGPSHTLYPLNFPTGSGVTTIAPFSGTSIANGASISGTSLTLGIADATNPGMVSTTTQTIGGNKTFNGNISVIAGSTSTAIIRHVEGAPPASMPPAIAAGTGAGTSPTVSLTGGDLNGVITVTTGTLPTASGVVVTVTYHSAYDNDTYPILQPANSLTALLTGATMVFTTGSTTTFTITAGTGGLAAATTYIWYYHVGAD